MEVLTESESERGSETESEVEDIQQAVKPSILGGEQMQVQPSDVRFTHRSISYKFRNGNVVDEVIDDLIDGKILFDDFPALICTEYKGRLFSLRNRRLFVARVLEQLNRLCLIRVEVIPFDHPYLKRSTETGITKWDQSLSTMSGGKFVRVHSKYEAKTCKEDISQLLARPRFPTVKPVFLSRQSKHLNGRSTMQEVKWDFQHKLPREALDQLAHVCAKGSHVSSQCN
eukprot:Skav211611  [mRNA]  locus=scaffold3083:124382:125065:- [translate_table: standard]